MKTFYLIVMVFILTVLYILLSNEFVVGMQPPMRRWSEDEPSFIEEPLKKEAYPELTESSSEILEGVQEMIIMMEVRNEID